MKKRILKKSIQQRTEGRSSNMKTSDGERQNINGITAETHTQANGSSQIESDLTGYLGAMEETGLNINTLYALVHRKKIPHMRLSSRLVRFSRLELRSWMRSHQVNAQA